MPDDLKPSIVQRAKAEGFDACGFAPASAPNKQADELFAYLQSGFHGGMAWMAETESRRGSPDSMWNDARSAIVFGLSYGTDQDPLAKLERRGEGNISVYAQGHDYHDVIKKKLKRIAGWLAQNQKCDVKVFVDTAPLMEKPLAQQAGIGWQGKHTNLVSRDLGSWFFLGAILTDLDIPPDEPHDDHCGNCQACLDICPTKAFPAPGQIDARRCISYLTIEHKGHIPVEFRKNMGNHIYGCDDCLAVCPWNKFAKLAREAKLAAREELKAPSLHELAILDDAAFRSLFRANPVKRIGRDRFVRNVLIAIGNSADGNLASVAENLFVDPSPLVRAMAIWALSRLATEPHWQQMKSKNRAMETDDFVRAEWDCRI